VEPTTPVDNKQVSNAVPADVVDQSRQEALWRDVNDYVDSGKADGFAGGRFEPDGRTVRIYWAGDPPAQLTRLAAKHTSQAVMTVGRVKYDRQQHIAVARKLVNEAERAGIRVVSAGRTPDFAGIRVRLEGTATAAQKDALRWLGATEIVEGEGALVPLSGRHDDSPPFFGGGVITNRDGDACSTGWAVLTAQGAEAMVTAQHCGTNKTYYTWGTPAGGDGNDNGVFVGRSNSGHDLTDSMLLTGADYHKDVFEGAWDGWEAGPIQDARDPAYWSDVCAEGGLSGAVCNARVEEVDVIGPGGGGPGFYARSKDGVSALGGRGDSGSPAIAYDGGRIVLRGMLEEASITHPADCPKAGDNAWYGWKRRLCFVRVFFVNQSAIHEALNVQPILTG
jgi:hypothetical protein